jgi:pimeloyl-ACP methyl ester carboxylesterase
MRNHGDSLPYIPEMTYLDMSNDLKYFIENQVIEKDKCKTITMIGHSMGGKAAMAHVLHV